MLIRLQEIHPSIVHYPVALIPTAVLTDAIGYATDNPALMEVGRRLMPIAAASAMLAGAAGVLAQGVVQAEGRAHRQLTTHRTLNIGLVAMTSAMALMRSRQERPSLGYLIAGFASMVALTYSAYLGGRMVYEHGVGVRPAGGLRPGAAPQIGADDLGRVARAAAEDTVRSAKMSARETARGELVPELTG